MNQRKASLGGRITIRGAAGNRKEQAPFTLTASGLYDSYQKFPLLNLSQFISARLHRSHGAAIRKPRLTARKGASMPGTPEHEPVDHPSLSAYVSQMEAKNLSYMNLLAYIHFLTLNRDMRTAILSEVREDVSKITYEMIHHVVSQRHFNGAAHS